jgi:PKD repeat protein
MAGLRVARPLLPGVHARPVGLLAAVLLCGLAGPSVARAAPAGTFKFDPPSPQTNQPVTLTADQADNPMLPLTYTWSADGGTLDSSSGQSAHITFATAGTYNVTLTVNDPADPVSGTATSTQALTATDPAPPPRNKAPRASFDVTPPTAAVGDTVTFTSTSTDPEGDAMTFAWELNQDGLFDDGTGDSAQKAFTSPGTYPVRLRVTDSQGASSTAMEKVKVVADVAPQAGFSFTPSAPRAGQPVTFTSTSTDPDGSIAALDWDLDGNRQFNDAGGTTAQRVFPVAGSYTVALRVTDDKGVSSTAFQTISVLGSATQEQDAPAGSTPGTSAPDALPPAAPVPSPGTSSAGRFSLLSPFPIIRIRGRADATAVHVDLLSVQAPRGSRITARCRGASCPRRAIATTAISSSRPVRLRGLERRFGNGTVLEIRVTKAGRIGKYTRFSMRRGRAPLRRDLCLRPGTTRPSRCPTQ